MQLPFRGREKKDEELGEEVRSHLTLSEREQRESGRGRSEARYAAHREFGNIPETRELARAMWGWRWIEDLLQDIRYSLRTLRARPGFLAVALLTLALGTGATASIFTIVNGVLLKPYPYKQPDRLVSMMEKTDYSTQFGNLWAYTYPNFKDCVGNVPAIAEMAAWRFSGGIVTNQARADYFNGREISHNLFSVLGISIPLGRDFMPDDDRLGATPVAIISYPLWQQMYGGSSSAVGSQLNFDGKSYSIVGVLPAGFRLADETPDVFTPIGQDTAPRMQNRGAHGVRVWGRLAPGATLAQADTQLDVIGRRLAAQYPASNKGRTFFANTLKPDVGDVGSTLWLLLGAVALVLLIACANVASLLLARAVAREREFAMRVALGASRNRLVRQCLTESAVLGLAGGALGVLLASLSVEQFVKYWPGALPRAEEVHLDWRVLLFVVGISLLSGFLFGLAPALRAPSRNLEIALRAGARTVAGGSRRLHTALVISELALAVILLVSAGMLGRTLLRLSLVNPGLDVKNVLTARVALSPEILKTPATTRAVWQDVLNRMDSVPGVEAAATVDTVPLREGNNPIGYRLSAEPVPDDKQSLVLANSVSPDYLRVTKIPLREGRFFTDQDRVDSSSVVVIDDVMAQQAFPGQDPIGKHLWIGLGPDPAIVVGVVGHIRYWGLASDDSSKLRATLYYPFAQVPDPLVRRWSELMSVAIRTSVPPMTILQPLRDQVRGVTGDQVVYEVNTLEHLASDSISQQRWLLVLFGVFAGLALALASVGIYGVLAYLTSQRVPEIGVRIALGATSQNVLRLILRQSFTMVAAGVIAGIAGALAAARILIRIVPGATGIEPLTFAVMTGVLVAAALAASFIPARRASRIDPIQALRQE
ncbi:MAG TPA: ABC transporter permease [Candidatus Acidoferrales bacterium]|nr:ABC transporter permease [Candidatus Acidoferrales bacterium]